jgi:hypothetical protein
VLRVVPPHISVPLPLISLFPYPEGRGEEEAYRKYRKRRINGYVVIK